MPPKVKRRRDLDRDLTRLPHPLQRQEAILRALCRELSARDAWVRIIDDGGNALSTFRVVGGEGESDGPVGGASRDADPVPEPPEKAVLSLPPGTPHLWPTADGSRSGGEDAAETSGGRVAALYRYPTTTDQRHVVIQVGWVAGSFRRAELPAFARACQKHESHFVLSPRGVTHGRARYLARHPVVRSLRYAVTHEPADHAVECDERRQARTLPARVVGLLTDFYGPPEAVSAGWKLPAELAADLERLERTYLAALARPPRVIEYSFTKRHHGRQLAIVARRSPGGLLRLVFHEDLEQLDRRTRIHAACRQLRRDRESVFAVCLALMDGVVGQREVLTAAGLGGLRADSGRRLVSCARRILSSAEAARTDSAEP